MNSVLHQRSFYCILAAGIMVVVLGKASSAWAHKIYLHAEAVGQKVEGRAYFRGGAPAQEAKVEVFLSDGRKLLETKTDANGQFSFQPPARCDYRLVVDTGDGHGAEYTLPAADLPETLPPLEKAALPPPEELSQPPPTASAKPSEKSLPPAQADGALQEKGQLPMTAEQWRQWIEEAVRRQVQPLARKIEQMEDRIRWSDVLGGIGYIVGLTGMGFYLLGMKKPGQPAASQKPTTSSDPNTSR